MKVSKRQQQIIEMLLKRQGEITVGEIAQEIDVSSRTVHRELLEIEAVLETYGVSLLKKAGIGIQIHADRMSLERLKADLFQVAPEEYTAEERKVLTMCMLLEADEPVKLFSLSHDLQAAIPTISNDLDEMEAWVQKNGLTLIRRRGYGVELVGSERMKRRAIGLLAQSHLDDSLLFGNAEEQPKDPVTRQLLAMVGRDHFFRIEKALWKLEEYDPTTITEGAYTLLLIRLSIAITRFRQGRRLQPEELSDLDLNLKEEHKRKFDCLAELLQLQLPPEEIAYIVHLLEAWEKDKGQGLLEPGELRQVELVTRLIRSVEEKLKLELIGDGSLKEGLLQHITPVLQRLRNGESIRNPLLSQIKKDYEELFSLIKSSVQGIADDVKLPDEEIGYLVMHFGAAMERNKQLSRKVRALLVCTSGIGSSKLLAVRIGKELPQIELLGHVSWFEAVRIPEEDYDLVISTVDLPLPPEQYIRLSPLLTGEEAEKLRAFIQNITLKRVVRRSGPSEQQTPGLSLLRNVRLYSQEIVELIEQFQVHPVSARHMAGQTDLRSIVEGMCEIIRTHNGLNRVEEIAERLIQREMYGSQVIPDSGLALFHTRSESVHSPILSLFRYDSPLQWQGIQGQQVKCILLMLGPKEMEKETLEILSEVSALLLEPEVIRRLEMDHEESIKRFFSKKFEQFIKSKLEWRE
jgi:mannitol operon transcriptional antiterminator